MFHLLSFLRKGSGGKLFAAMRTGFLPFTFHCQTCDFINEIFNIIYFVLPGEPVSVDIDSGSSLDLYRFKELCIALGNLFTISESYYFSLTSISTGLSFSSRLAASSSSSFFFSGYFGVEFMKDSVSVCLIKYNAGTQLIRYSLLSLTD